MVDLCRGARYEHRLRISRVEIDSGARWTAGHALELGVDPLQSATREYKVVQELQMNHTRCLSVVDRVLALIVVEILREVYPLQTCRGILVVCGVVCCPYCAACDRWCAPTIGNGCVVQIWRKKTGGDLRGEVDVVDMTECWLGN